MSGASMNKIVIIIIIKPNLISSLFQKFIIHTLKLLGKVESPAWDSSPKIVAGESRSLLNLNQMKQTFLYVYQYSDSLYDRDKTVQ